VYNIQSTTGPSVLDHIRSMGVNLEKYIPQDLLQLGAKVRRMNKKIRRPEDVDIDLKDWKDGNIGIFDSSSVVFITEPREITLSRN